MASNLPPDPIYVFRGSNSAITFLKFFPSDESTNTISNLAVGNQDGELMIWDLKIRGVAKRWKAHCSSVLWIHPISLTRLWTEGRSEFVILWELGSRTPIKLYEFPISEYLGFSQCSLSKNNDFIAIPGGNSGDVIKIDVNKKSPNQYLHPDNREKRMVMTIKWVSGYSEVENLIVAYESGHISLWDIECLSIISEIKLNNTPICFGFCETSSLGLCGTSSDEIVVVHLSKDVLTLGKKVSIKNEGISSCCFRSDGKIYATGGWDHRIRLFSRKNEPLVVLKYHKDTVECIEFSKYPLCSFPPGLILACGSADHSISLWHLYS